MHRRRLAPLAALALASTLVLGGCGGDDDPTPSASPEPSPSESNGSSTPSESPSPSESPAGTRIEITRTGDTFDPSGARVEVGIGEPVVLVIDADTGGSLHVHSTPEQDVTYTAGTSEHEIVVDRPGVVEVESHDPDLVVLQLEVR
jgi:hypothetical protein